MKRQKKPKMLSFKDMPFSRLVEEVEELSDIRSEYAKKSKKQRNRAAEYQYYESYTGMLFNELMGEKLDEDLAWTGEMVALAIDPDHAPAILTVGSYEYLYGRKDEAMTHFLKLTRLSKNTEDLTAIIDKAGDFLIQKNDFDNAIILYTSAAKKYPGNPVYHNGLSYCYGRTGDQIRAVEEVRVAVSLDPENHVYLTDMGWALVEANLYDEAQSILEHAVKVAPLEYDLARNNLEELQRRRKQSSNYAHLTISAKDMK